MSDDIETTTYADVDLPPLPTRTVKALAAELTKEEAKCCQNALECVIENCSIPDWCHDEFGVIFELLETFVEDDSEPAPDAPTCPRIATCHRCAQCGKCASCGECRCRGRGKR